MRAIVIRHGKVDFQWEKMSTSEQFNKECQMYDEAPIFPLLSDVIQINYQDIYISTLQRSRDTAKQLFGEKDFIPTKLLDEVPLCAGVILNKKMPLLFWNILARLQWFFNIHSQKECRKETVYRAEQFIEIIAEKEKDCIIVTHGFFMHTLLNQMKQPPPLAKIRNRKSRKKVSCFFTPILPVSGFSAWENTAAKLEESTPCKPGENGKSQHSGIRHFLRARFYHSTKFR